MDTKTSPHEAPNLQQKVPSSYCLAPTNTASKTIKPTEELFATAFLLYLRRGGEFELPGQAAEGVKKKKKRWLLPGFVLGRGKGIQKGNLISRMRSLAWLRLKK